MKYPIPRQTLVLVRTFRNHEQKVGEIVVPDMNKGCYCNAEVLAVGPGNTMLSGGPSETEDLQVGQLVWIRSHKMGGPGGQVKVMEGISLNIEGERNIALFEQSNILTILRQPGDWDRRDYDGEARTAEPDDDNGGSPVVIA